MRFEATKSDLIAEARAALAAADRDLRSSRRPDPRERLREAARQAVSNLQPSAPQPPSQPQSQSPEQSRSPEELQRALDDIAAELAAVDESMLDRARAEMESAIERYVSACVVYNRILAEIRQQLRELGDVPEEQVNYQSESGQPGVRVNDVVRLQALPWQTVSRVALSALSSHAPVERMSLDSPIDQALDDLEPARDEPEPVLDAQAEPAQPEPPAPSVDMEQVEELFDEKIAPVLAFIHDQQSGLNQVREQVTEQSAQIAALREAIERHGDAAARIAAYFDALREAQSRLGGS